MLYFWHLLSTGHLTGRTTRDSNLGVHQPLSLRRWYAVCRRAWPRTSPCVEAKHYFSLIQHQLIEAIERHHNAISPGTCEVMPRYIFRRASTGRGGIGNKKVFPVSLLGQRNGSRVLVPPARYLPITAFNEIKLWRLRP